MESKERMFECPECGELMPALLLNDLNKCDNCGFPAHLFDLVTLPEEEILGDFMAVRDF
jgi:hypothetical protein